MNREQAYEELTERLKAVNLVKHSLAVEAIMKRLAEILKEDEEKWGLAGLLHDIDLDRVGNDMTKHSLAGAEILEDIGVDSSVVYAVRAHNSYHGIIRRRMIDKALFCSDPVSGLITAAALILPSKKLNDVTPDFILRRFNESAFAKNVSREQILECNELGLSLELFIETALNAMKEISGDLGL